MKAKIFNLLFVLFCVAIVGTMIAFSVNVLWIVLAVLVLGYIGWGTFNFGMPIAVSKPIEPESNDENDIEAKRNRKARRVWLWHQTR
ncbi:MAG: hypothetical protein AAF902_03810 [Chloroflexota bacterium]